MKPHTYLVAALASLFIRSLAVLFTATVHLPPFLRNRTTLTICTSEQDFLDFNLTQASCVGLPCLDFCNGTANNGTDCFNHRFRHCGDDDDFQMRATLYVCLAAATILSLISSLRLSHLSKYTNLYQASKDCCLQAIVHRSLFFSKIREGDLGELKPMLEHFDLSKQDHEGYSPVHIAVLHADNENSLACLSLLLSHGASHDRDSKGYPLHTAIRKRNFEAIDQLLNFGAKVLPSSDGHLPINWYGDSHAAFEDGQSRLVGFAKADKSGLLERLYSQQKEDQPEEERSNVGVRHLILGHSDLSCTLKVTKNKELLALLNPSLPLTNFTKEEGEALTRELADLGIVPEEEAFWADGEKQEDVTWWTDKENNGKRLTSIQVAVDDRENWISKLRVAFNGEWCEWRETAESFGNPVEQPPLEIGDEETIIAAETSAWNSGSLTSLELRLSSGRQQFWGSTNTERLTRTEDSTKLKTKTGRRPLAYLSGGKAYGGNHGRLYQLTFHWENSGSCT